VITVRRAADRFATPGEGLTSRHSFSFGAHYDPANTSFGPLLLHDEHRLAAGHGFASHPHRELEVVTWVLAGELQHEDSGGRSGVVHPGLVQRLSAGRGVLHSERNDAPGAVGPTRFVQMWLRPDDSGLDPTYALAPVDRLSGLVPVASGVRGLDAAVRVHTTGAALHVGRLARGEVVTAPDAARLHVFVAGGAVDVEGAGRLQDGDAARFTAEGGPRLTATEPSEVLVWQLP
jgi:redox-sensitive bicupin YhaK (pirin superfamily)